MQREQATLLQTRRVGAWVWLDHRHDFAMTRQAISKKLRFEIFKRDSFRCQYCGASAPEVLLHVDHLKPIVEGGGNDILNLITSCVSCNLGKGRHSLNDHTMMEKQKEQLKELNERRAQLEMLVAWREELSSLKDEAADRVAEFWSNNIVLGFSLNKGGLQELKKILRKFSVDEVLDAMQIAADQYFELKDGAATLESVEKAWSKVSGICRVKQISKKKPYLPDLYYVRGILRRRVYVNEGYIMELLEAAVGVGIETEWLKSVARRCRSWTGFCETVHSMIKECEEANPTLD